MSNHQPEDDADTQAQLNRLAAGDLSQRNEIFGQLFERHESSLERIIAARMDHRLKKRLDSADVLQETYLEALQRIDHFLTQRPMPFYLWLQRTARQCAIAAYRRHIAAGQRSLEKEQGLPDHSSVMLADRLLDQSKSPSQKLQQREHVDLVFRAVESLKEEDRDILLMRIVDGLSHAEIACTLQLSHDAVRQRFLRTLTKLQKALGQFDIGSIIS
ncbi:MAG: sigma-70 family RNA polymerase sigma factor [Pirellulaceae bacterium]